MVLVSDMSSTTRCRQCGAAFTSEANFCPNCGVDRSSGGDTPLGGEERQTKSNTDFDTSVRKLLYEDDERVIDVLGRGYVNSALAGDSLSKSLLVLSDKRLYQKGKRYKLSKSGNWSTERGSKVLSIKDVTGVSYNKKFESKNGIIFLILLFTVSLSLSIIFELYGVIPIVIIGSIVGITFLLLMNKKLFVIEYSGGRIGVEVGWYSEENINSFRRKLFLEKGS